MKPVSRVMASMYANLTSDAEGLEDMSLLELTLFAGRRVVRQSLVLGGKISLRSFAATIWSSIVAMSITNR